MAITDKIPVEAIKKALAENPVLKWAVIAFVVIFAVEFLAKEGIGIWKEVTTARLEVESKNQENYWAIGRPREGKPGEEKPYKSEQEADCKTELCRFLKQHPTTGAP